MNKLPLPALCCCICLLVWVACDDPVDPTATLGDVIIINEGNFTSGDATLSGYVSNTGDTAQQLFISVNGFPIGATIQKVAEHQNRYYLICNSPDKLEVIRKSDLVWERTISSADLPMQSPFRMAFADGKAFLTNWGEFNGTTFQYENSSLVVFDPDNITDQTVINLQEQPQDLLALQDQIYMTMVSSNRMYIIDAPTLAFVDTLYTEAAPDKIAVDRNQDVWVICNSGHIQRIDPSNANITLTIEQIEVSGFNEQWVVGPEGNYIYYLSSEWAPDFSYTENTVYRLPITYPADPIETVLSRRNLYALGVSPDQDIYVGDAKAFQIDGEVIRYDAAGNQVDIFPVGRNPNGFIFR